MSRLFVDERSRLLLVPVTISLVLALAGACLAPPTGQSSVDAPSPFATAAPAVTLRIGRVATTDDRLNVRSGPGADFDIVGKLPVGSEVTVTVTSSDGAWHQVQVEGIEGDAWVSAQFVEISEQPPVAGQSVVTQTEVSPSVATTETATISLLPTPTPQATPTVPTAFVQPNRMNVRSGPGTNYNVVSSVGAGAGLEILALSPNADWYQVRVDGVAEPGWIAANLAEAMGPLDGLKRLSEEELPAAPTPAPQAAAAPAAVAAPIVSAPPPTGGGPFGYGVQAHLLSGSGGGAMGYVSDMGFNWIKQQAVWKFYQPQPGPIGFGDLHAIVNDAGSRGINVLYSVVGAPDWAREPGFDGGVNGPPADPQTLASFVGNMAGQFCGTALKAIEVWNEQNLHYEWGNKDLNPADYVALLAPSYAAIKSACPSMYVISGALTPTGGNPPLAIDDFAYLEGMFQAGLNNYIDGVGAHPSGYNVPPSVTWEGACAAIQQFGNSFNGACDTPHHSWSFRSTMEGYRNIMNVYGASDKKVWPTEFGWAAGGAFDPRYAYANDNSYDEQAAWTVEAYQMMKAWGWVGPAILWNLNFRVVADGTEQAQWGIVRNDYSPLPVYDALKAMPK